MVLHALVDVQIGARRRVKARQQLVHHHQQLHLRRLFDEQALGPLFVGFGPAQARLGLYILQQFVVAVVDELFVGFIVGAGFFQRHVLGLRVVRRDQRAAALEAGVSLAEQHKVFAGLVDAAGDQNGVAAGTAQARPFLEVAHDVLHDLAHARLGAEHVLHRAPLRFQLILLPVVQAT